MQDAVAKHRTLVDRNHGADIDYLRSLFVPLGVYVDPSPDARSALTHIANARGTFAHRRTTLVKGRFAYRPISATKAVAITEQLFHWCLEFDEQIVESLRPAYGTLETTARKELAHELALVLSGLAAQKTL